MNAIERLKELIYGGPYELVDWVIMVHLAVDADDEGLVKRPSLADAVHWVGSRERALNSIKRLKDEEWVVLSEDGRYDISVSLRQAPRACADIAVPPVDPY